MDRFFKNINYIYNHYKLVNDSLEVRKRKQRDETNEQEISTIAPSLVNSIDILTGADN